MNFFDKPALTLTHILEPQETPANVCLQHIGSLEMRDPRGGGWLGAQIDIL